MSQKKQSEKLICHLCRLELSPSSTKVSKYIRCHDGKCRTPFCKVCCTGNAELNFSIEKFTKICQKKQNWICKVCMGRCKCQYCVATLKNQDSQPQPQQVVLKEQPFQAVVKEKQTDLQVPQKEAPIDRKTSPQVEALDSAAQRQEDSLGRQQRQRACKKNIEYCGINENDKYFEAQINQGQEELARERQVGVKTGFRDLQESLKYDQQLSNRTQNPNHLTNGLSALKYLDWNHTEMDAHLEETDDMLLKVQEGDNILNYDEFLKVVDQEEEPRPHFNCVNKEKNLRILTYSLRKRIWKMSKTNGVIFRTKLCEDVSATETSKLELQNKPSVKIRTKVISEAEKEAIQKSFDSLIKNSVMKEKNIQKRELKRLRVLAAKKKKSQHQVSTSQRFTMATQKDEQKAASKKSEDNVSELMADQDPDSQELIQMGRKAQKTVEKKTASQLIRVKLETGEEKAESREQEQQEQKVKKEIITEVPVKQEQIRQQDDFQAQQMQHQQAVQQQMQNNPFLQFQRQLQQGMFPFPMGIPQDPFQQQQLQQNLFMATQMDINAQIAFYNQLMFMPMLAQCRYPYLMPPQFFGNPQMMPPEQWLRQQRMMQEQQMQQQFGMPDIQQQMLMQQYNLNNQAQMQQRAPFEASQAPVQETISQQAQVNQQQIKNILPFPRPQKGTFDVAIVKEQEKEISHLTNSKITSQGDLKQQVNQVEQQMMQQVGIGQQPNAAPAKNQLEDKASLLPLPVRTKPSNQVAQSHQLENPFSINIEHIEKLKQNNEEPRKNSESQQELLVAPEENKKEEQEEAKQEEQEQESKRESEQAEKVEEKQSQEEQEHMDSEEVDKLQKQDLGFQDENQLQDS